jgi:hypothetical protein
MKTERINCTTRITVLLCLIAFIFTSNVNAQFLSASKPHLPKNAIENIIQGIHHEIDQIKKSSIYMAGKYQINETVDALFERKRIPTSVY